MDDDGRSKRPLDDEAHDDERPPSPKRARFDEDESSYGSDTALEEVIGLEGRGARSVSDESELSYQPPSPDPVREQQAEDRRRWRRDNPMPPAPMRDPGFEKSMSGKLRPQMLVELNADIYVSISQFKSVADPERERGVEWLNNELASKNILLLSGDGRSYLSPKTLAEQDRPRFDELSRRFDLDPFFDERPPLRNQADVLVWRDKNSFVSGASASAYLMLQGVDLRKPEWQRELQHDVFVCNSTGSARNDYFDLACFTERRRDAVGAKLLMGESQLDTLGLGGRPLWRNVPDPKCSTPETDAAVDRSPGATPPRALTDAEVQSGVHYVSLHAIDKLNRELPDYQRSGLPAGPRRRPIVAVDPVEDDNTPDKRSNLWRLRMDRFLNHEPEVPAEQAVEHGAAEGLTAASLKKLQEHLSLEDERRAALMNRVRDVHSPER